MKLTKKLRRELAVLSKLRDEDIDTSDIPEVTDWSDAVRGRFVKGVNNAPRGSEDAG